MVAHELEHGFIDVGGISLHVVQAGPASGKPVILLHGFPDAWFGWRPQIAALAGAGYRVIIPDQRGYNTSEKPRGVRQYFLGHLLNDLAGLADELQLGKFHLVGHDWGGIVAWAAGAQMSEHVDKLVILNAPHPEVLLPHALRSPSQLLRSSYVAFFQLPLLPETVLGAHDSQLLVRALLKSSRPGAFTDGDIAEYRRAWARPGALTAMLNWYRALRYRKNLKQRISTPTLVLWGKQDQALELGLAQLSLGLCDNGRLEIFENATHWLHREEAPAVNAALLSFLEN
jgi:pimeloyl-ACP methyl ester carboxylesterase